MIKIFDNTQLILASNIILENQLYHSKEWLLYFDMKLINSKIDKNKNHVISIFYKNDMPIGCLFLKCRFKRDAKGVKYRHYFLETFIKEQYRNKGIGKTLLKETISQLSLEYRISKLDYRQGIIGSLDFYDKVIGEINVKK